MESRRCGEGKVRGFVAWKRMTPGVIIAGRNAVNVDAVGMAVMGYDPYAERGTPPFIRGDNSLRLAEEAGIATRDLKRIEVVGLFH
jgi:hypothetical protein